MLLTDSENCRYVRQTGWGRVGLDIYGQIIDIILVAQKEGLNSSSYVEIRPFATPDRYLLNLFDLSAIDRRQLKDYNLSRSIPPLILLYDANHQSTGTRLCLHSAGIDQRRKPVYMQMNLSNKATGNERVVNQIKPLPHISRKVPSPRNGSSKKLEVDIKWPGPSDRKRLQPTRLGHVQEKEAPLLSRRNNSREGVRRSSQRSASPHPSVRQGETVKQRRLQRSRHIFRLMNDRTRHFLSNVPRALCGSSQTS